jgi:phospholipase/carboxylesterase
MAAKTMNGEEISIDGWAMRLHHPAGEGPFPVLLMLHGWTGDENSMWIFTGRLPKNALLIAPRGLYTAENSGYGWQAIQSDRWGRVEDFQPAVEKVLTTINERIFPEGDFSRLHIIGFSQGAAFAYVMGLLYPERITSLAGLSGFLPEGTSPWISPRRLAGLPVFITHGTQDERVPVEKARHSVEMLEKAGATVTYCEDDVGHRLSVKCFQGLEAFYQRINR